MSIAGRLKAIAGVALHGLPRPVYAEISYMPTSGLLIGKKIIITGGSRGLGFSMAKRFVSEGAKVIITGRNENRLRRAAEEIGCDYIVFDVCNLTSCNDFIEKAERILDGANTLVNNAGISLHENSFFEVTPETFHRQLVTNLEAPFFLTQAFAKLIIENKRQANVLFISSETGDTVDFRPYGFTKGAVNSMVKGLAYLFKTKGIRVNAIAPGVTASDMTGLTTDGDISAGNYGIGRYYLPDEIAQIATLLLSDSTGIVSGQIITCNNAQTVNARWK